MTCGVCTVDATAVFSGVSQTFFVASTFESVAGAVDGDTVDGAGADDGAGDAVVATAPVVAIDCIIVVTVDVGVIELDADCTTIFEFTLYRYASYSGSGSTKIVKVKR